MELINISDVSKRYKNGVTAIYDLDLKIKKGEFVFVIGGSGSGKSTLIKMLYREEKPDKGEIYIGGINVAKLASLPDEVIKRASEILEIYENKEKKKDVLIQTSLPLEFEEKPNEVVEELKNLNVLELTPIKAINILYELKEKIK